MPYSREPSTLGLDVTEHDNDWSEVDANGVKLGLNGSEPESPHGDGGALVAFQPDGEIDEVVHRLPFKDPDGNDLQLYEPPSG